ncbi:MAG: ABC transporter substrate-binding protein [Deltaproteobacteria bacterium]|nr:ABC transporter substrate-binding protein [Deltaproteobacteria bacterium]
MVRISVSPSETPGYTLAMRWALLLHSVLSLAGPHPIGDLRAVRGGTFTISFFGYPKSLNYYLADEELAETVAELVQEPLIELNPDTHEPNPRLAKSWRISPDKLTYTFQIDPSARFSDGKPVTAEDVVFTWSAIHSPDHKTAPFQSLFDSYQSVRAVDSATVEFKAKIAHFQNIEKLSKLFVLPRHVYSSGDFNKAFNTTLTGSGPYRLKEAVTDEKIILERLPNYWGAQLTQNIGRYNFDKILLKSGRDADVSLEILKKGEIDYFYFLGAKMWSTQTNSQPFQSGWIKKLRGENLSPVGTQGLFWNLRRPLFQDRRVRLALSHLLNRERFIHEIFYDNYRISTGVVAPHSPYQPKGLTPISYNPKKAKELLTAAGWTLSPSGILVKEGKPFEFEMLIENPLHQRYLTIYQEDLKRLGITMNIRVQDWATCLRLIDDRQFDGHLVVRTRMVDPYNMNYEWGSREADIKGSGNIAGYKNPRVDRLAVEIDRTFDRKKRIRLVAEVVKLIADDAPFTPMWEPKYFRIGFWDRYSFPGPGYFRYSKWHDAFQYWWLDPEKDRRLKSAIVSAIHIAQ